MILFTALQSDQRCVKVIPYLSTPSHLSLKFKPVAEILGLAGRSLSHSPGVNDQAFLGRQLAAGPSSQRRLVSWLVGFHSAPFRWRSEPSPGSISTTLLSVSNRPPRARWTQRQTVPLGLREASAQAHGPGPWSLLRLPCLPTLAVYCFSLLMF